MKHAIALLILFGGVFAHGEVDAWETCEGYARNLDLPRWQHETWGAAHAINEEVTAVVREWGINLIRPGGSVMGRIHHETLPIGGVVVANRLTGLWVIAFEDDGPHICLYLVHERSSA